MPADCDVATPIRVLVQRQPILLVPAEIAAFSLEIVFFVNAGFSQICLAPSIGHCIPWPVITQ
jgi:hypothetical protein